jgi:hypothetical protein
MLDSTSTGIPSAYRSSALNGFQNRRYHSMLHLTSSYISTCSVVFSESNDDFFQEILLCLPVLCPAFFVIFVCTTVERN